MPSVKFHMKKVLVTPKYFLLKMFTLNQIEGAAVSLTWFTEEMQFKILLQNFQILISPKFPNSKFVREKKGLQNLLPCDINIYTSWFLILFFLLKNWPLPSLLFLKTIRKGVSWSQNSGIYGFSLLHHPIRPDLLRLLPTFYSTVRRGGRGHGWGGPTGKTFM